MAVKLKDETILDRWSMLIDGAASHADALLRDIDKRLMAAQIPGLCLWDVEEVKSGGLFASTSREFLIVRLDQFSDYRIYIGVRDYGASLDVCRFLTLEPGFLKRRIAKALPGADHTKLSAPKNLLDEQDLRAWVTVVHHCVIDAAKSLVRQLGDDPAGIRRESTGFLQVW